MDEVFEFCGAQLDELSKLHPVDDDLFRVVAGCLFDHDITVIKIGVFWAYCMKLSKNHPTKRDFIYRKAFEVVSEKLKFD